MEFVLGIAVVIGLWVWWSHSMPYEAKVKTLLERSFGITPRESFNLNPEWKENYNPVEYAVVYAMNYYLVECAAGRGREGLDRTVERAGEFDKKGLVREHAMRFVVYALERSYKETRTRTVA